MVRVTAAAPGHPQSPPAIRIRTDDAVRLPGRDRHFGVAEIDRDHRHLRRARGAMSVPESPIMIASAGLAAGARDRPPQNFRIGLLHAERVLAADRGEVGVESELVEQEHATAIRACWCRPRDGEPLGGESIERASSCGKGRERSAMWSA